MTGRWGSRLLLIVERLAEGERHPGRAADPAPFRSFVHPRQQSGIKPGHGGHLPIAMVPALQFGFENQRYRNLTGTAVRRRKERTHHMGICGWGQFARTPPTCRKEVTDELPPAATASQVEWPTTGREEGWRSTRLSRTSVVRSLRIS